MDNQQKEQIAYDMYYEHKQKTENPCIDFGQYCKVYYYEILNRFKKEEQK